MERREKSPSPLENRWWESLAQRLSKDLPRALVGLSEKADRIQLCSLRGGDVLQAVLVNLCLCVPYLAFAHYRSKIALGLHFLLGSGAPAPLDPSTLPWTSGLYPVAHALFALTFFLPPPARTAVVIASSLGLIVATPHGDPFSALALAAYLIVVWGIARWAAIGLTARFAAVMLTYILFMNACHLLAGSGLRFRWPFSGDPVIVSLTNFAAGFAPMLWYAVHAVSAGKMSFLPFGYYFACRFFTAPVFSPEDLRIEEHARREWQWRGVAALGSSFLGAALSWALGERFLDFHHPDWFASSGLRLLGYSYCYYLSVGFFVQAWLSLFLGLARLFAMPIPNNFNFWFLARTPNERWRRWNMLFREWIVTSVFFPLMRAKRGLFVAIMASLLSSGLVHLVSKMIPGGLTVWVVAVELAYWTLNGLAVYAVVSFPRRWPSLVERLGLRDSLIWSVAGILLTGAFYSVLFVARWKCDNWGELVAFLSRLTGI